MPYIDVNTCLKDNVFQKSDNVKVESGKLVFSNIDFDSLSLHHNNNVIINGKTIDLKKIENTTYTNGLDLLFDNCKFSEVNAKEVTWSNSVVIKFSLIEKVNIKSSVFKERFYFNPQYHEDKEEYICKISSFIVEDSTFEHNFKFHNCEACSTNINNTDFEKNADFFKSKFIQKDKDIVFKSINFRGLVLFGECKFHSKLIFEYVTLKGLSHFREAEFFKGLDLDKANIENEMIFYAVEGLQKTEYISQETYRIIKYNCQKIGNQIEANKYHSFELKKRQEFLNKNFFKNKLDWVVFNINWITSNFSTNWLLTTFWIFVVGFLTFMSVDEFVCYRYQCTVEFIDVFKYMSIVNLDECIKKNPLIFITNKVMLGFLYYQLITAIRKDTKR